MVELLSIVKVPVPKAPALLISNTAPVSRVTPPLNVLFPDNVNVPDESVTVPVPVPIAPLKTRVPGPTLVILCVPPIAPPTVRV